MPAAESADLAYLKRMALAGRGRAAPALVLMAVFGLGYGLTSLSLYVGTVIGFDAMGAAGLESLPSLLLMLSHAAFLLGLCWTGWRFMGPDRARLSRAAAAVWSGAFIAFLVLTAGLLAFSRDQAPSDHVYAAYFYGPMLLAVWGMAWWATAFLTQRRWLLLVATGSFAASLLAAAAGNAPLMLLVAAASLLLLAFAPAVILLREPARQ